MIKGVPPRQFSADCSGNCFDIVGWRRLARTPPKSGMPSSRRCRCWRKAGRFDGREAPVFHLPQSRIAAPGAHDGTRSRV